MIRILPVKSTSMYDQDLFLTKDVYKRQDEQIPFCEYFIVPYLLWFLFVAVTVFYFMFFNKNQWKEYYQLIITLGTGMTLFLIISLVFPNGQDLRPVLTGDSIFIKAVQMIYHTDTPTNVLPSIHVFNSLACCVAILKNQRKYKKSTDTACAVSYTHLGAGSRS